MTFDPEINRQIVLIERPVGIPQVDHFELVCRSIPKRPKGHILVRNIYLSVDAAQRGWATDVDNYIPPVTLNEVMRSLGFGEIIESDHTEYRVGDFVYGWLGWQDYAVIIPSDILIHHEQPAHPLPAYLGVLGINGLTAYLSLKKMARLNVGETVCVTTAAGAVGSLVGQICKAQGCRVIGFTGTDEKVRNCIANFGYDDVRNYNTCHVESVIKDMAPDGVDVFFDQVGGEVLDIVLRHMNIAARIIQCGTASVASWKPNPVGLRNEREVLKKRLSWNGFVVFDHMGEASEAQEVLGEMMLAGKLKYDVDILEGIEQAKHALARLYGGKNTGKLLIDTNL